MIPQVIVLLKQTYHDLGLFYNAVCIEKQDQNSAVENHCLQSIKGIVKQIHMNQEV